MTEPIEHARMLRVVEAFPAGWRAPTADAVWGVELDYGYTMRVVAIGSEDDAESVATALSATFSIEREHPGYGQPMLGLGVPLGEDVEL